MIAIYLKYLCDWIVVLQIVIVVNRLNFNKRKSKACLETSGLRQTYNYCYRYPSKPTFLSEESSFEFNACDHTIYQCNDLLTDG